MNPSDSPPPHSSRRIVLALWLTAVPLALVAFFLFREHLDAEGIARFLQRFGNHLLVAYLGLSVARAFFLIPSTPFVLAGGILFPSRPAEVLAISMAGIALSATAIYYFSDWLGFRAHFQRLSRTTVERMERALSGRLGFVYLTAWSFFPLVPTDAACYLAGMVRMNFWKFLAAICLGELVICIGYVYAGRGLSEVLF